MSTSTKEDCRHTPDNPTLPVQSDQRRSTYGKARVFPIGVQLAQRFMMFSVCSPLCRERFGSELVIVAICSSLALKRKTVCCDLAACAFVVVVSCSGEALQHRISLFGAY